MTKVLIVIVLIIAALIITIVAYKNAKEAAKRRELERQREAAYCIMENEILNELGFRNWNIVDKIDQTVSVKSRQTLENYDMIKLLRKH